MTDDTIETTKVSPIKPPVAEIFPAKPDPETKPEPAAPLTAKDRLRAFEDEHFGPDAVRVNGEIERGHGSPFAEMDERQHRQYAAIELLIAAEQRLADSTAALASAEAEHEAAMARLDALEANASG